LRPEAVQALSGSELILHAGDVGSEDVLDRLRRIAPVIAVRGNVDSGVWADALPITAAVELGEHRIWMLHDLGNLDLDPVCGGFGIVIYGHSHQPVQQVKNGVIYLNPGSAGPRRFRLPVSVVRADFAVNPPSITFIDLLTSKQYPDSEGSNPLLGPPGHGRLR
jgi:putative phosphoesterase